LFAAPSQIGGNSDAAVIDVSNPNNSWLVNNPTRFASHGSAGFGSIPGTFNYAQSACGATQAFFCGTTNLTPSQSVNAPFTNFAIAVPPFAGLSAVSPITQTYTNATQAATVSPFPFFVDWKAVNGTAGISGQESNTSFGNSFTATLAAGTTKTYLISADCCVSSPDYKRWGMQGYAGRWWLKDISSPVTFGSAADMADWSVCQAFHANECVFGSTPRQFYATLPKFDANGSNKCVSATFALATPCLSAFGPWSGQTIQFRIDQAPAATTTRKFGFVHGHVGLPYIFSNCRTTPDGQFMFCPGYWLDGVRTEWLALRIGAQPPTDNVDRTTFVPINLSYQGVPFASNIRARFGYADNGGDLLRCTAYGQDCSTEIPSGSPGDPFSFTNEAVTLQACANGATCTITIPSLPNRILYYVVDRLDNSGAVLQTSPLQAIAVP
jgi:hypothetical protein